jgi:NTE family protein
VDTGITGPRGVVSLFQVHFDKDHDRIGPMGGMAAVGLFNYRTRSTPPGPAAPASTTAIPFARWPRTPDGKAVVLRRGNLASALRASMSIPGSSTPGPWRGSCWWTGTGGEPPRVHCSGTLSGTPHPGVNLSPDDITKDRKSFRSITDVISQT